MPSYADPLGQLGRSAGGILGGAGGGGASSLLSNLLSPLDYPRQALYNLARSGARAVTGEGGWDDVASALPGALGAGLAGGLALTGVGAPAAIGLGSLLGGVAQGAGKATGRGAFDAPEVSDITGTEDFLPNFLVGAITDPLTYAGGIGGGRAGAKVGQQIGKDVGRGLEEAAVWAGPKYGGGASKVSEAIAASGLHPITDVDKIARLKSYGDQIMSNPALLGEFAPGSKFVNMGESAAAFQAPQELGGAVTTFRRPSRIENEVTGLVDFSKPPPTRVDLPEMLQAERSKPFPGSPGFEPMRVEHAPYVDMIKKPYAATPEEQLQLAMRRQQANVLQNELLDKGVNAWDLHAGNVANVGGKSVVADANAIHPQAGFMGDPLEGWQGTDLLPRAAEMAQRQPNMVQNALLKLLGADKTVQQELAQAIQRGPRVGTGQVPSVFGLEAAGVVPRSPMMSGQSSTDILNPNRAREARIDRILANALGRRG